MSPRGVVTLTVTALPLSWTVVFANPEIAIAMKIVAIIIRFIIVSVYRVNTVLFFYQRVSYREETV